MVGKIDRNKLIVTQSNKLVKASYTMTLDEKRIVILLLSVIRADDTDFKVYRFPITDIRDYLKLNTKNLYADIKKITGLLRSRNIDIPEDDGGWLQVGWVSSARYVPKGKYGADCACLDLKFDPDLKPHLLELKAQFSSYTLQNVASLSGFNHIRLYELLNSYRKMRTVRFAPEELKRILKLDGKYDNYKDFKIRVLLAAQKELAEKTDLTFDFEDNAARGRKVAEIVFHIRNNTPSNPEKTITDFPALPKQIKQSLNNSDERQTQLLPPTEIEQETAKAYREAIAAGIENGVREDTLRELLKTRDPRQVIENIELARTRHINSKREGADLAALTVAAITQDYAADGRGKRQSVADKAAVRRRSVNARELLERIETAAIAARRHDLKTRLDAIPEAELSALRASFVEEVEAGKRGDHMAAECRSRGWKAAGMEATFRIFAAAHFGIESEEEYQRKEAARRGHEFDALKAEAGK